VSPVGHCYILLAPTVTWHQARDGCLEIRGHLATLTTDVELEFVASFESSSDTWIGLSRFGAINFSWITNEPFSFTNWELDAPQRRPESAVVIAPNTGLWSDRAPRELHPTLCEIQED
jgi:hypothetical protein